VLYGSFRTKKEADNALRELAILYKLCPRRIGIEPWGDGACLAHQMKRCAGVCAGKEDHAEHDERLLKVLESLRIRRWPWPGPVAIREHHAETGRSAVHLVDRWCLLGSVTDESELAGAARRAAGPGPFDLDTYRILLRWLDTPAGRSAVPSASMSGAGIARSIKADCCLPFAPIGFLVGRDPDRQLPQPGAVRASLPAANTPPAPPPGSAGSS
jgi:hypothetical protein